MFNIRSEMEESIKGMGRYLYQHQVLAKDLNVRLTPGDEAKLEYYFLRKDPGPYAFRVKREKEGLLISAAEGETGTLAVEPGVFFRLFPGRGVKNPANGEGGISYYFPGFDPSVPDRVELIAYDRGGIFDELVNMEAFLFEPQVAGTYYADAYSAFTFAWLADNGCGEHYREGAAMALDFVRRIYPSYEATHLDGMPHSDFKNPAYIETVEELMAAHCTDGDLSKWRSLYNEMIPNEEYSPTNVYALRYHWWSAINYYLEQLKGEKSSYDPTTLLERLSTDQTADGLIRDNNYSEISFGGYSDAYDLTYHLYALSWLARGFEYLPLDRIWSMLEKGAAFSLSLTTPGGEATYLGRSANNIYHLVSALYVYLKVASRNREQAPQYYRAVRLIFDYIKPFQLPEGNYPVGLNDYPEELIGWSHCQTPYNATNAYFLIRCLELLPHNWQEEPLELEKETLLIYPDSRLAAQSNKKFYYIIFAGSDISPYPHSGVHNTGVAGLAMLGLQGGETMLPVLEQSLREGEWSTSDLPDIELADGTIEVPINRGLVKRNEQGCLTISIAYGGFLVTQVYTMDAESLLIKTFLQAEKEIKCRLVGAPGLAVRCDEGYEHHLANAGFTYSTPHGSFHYSISEHSLPEGRWEVMEPSTTGKGYHRKIAWCSDLAVQAGDKVSYSARIVLKKNEKEIT